MAMDAEKEKKKEKFLPGTESEDQFDKVLSALSELINTSKVDIDLDLDGDIDISLHDKTESLLSSSLSKDLPAEDAVGIIEYEIPALLSASLSDNAKEWLIRSLPDKIIENMDSMIGRSKKVFKELGSEELKKRLLLRKGTNAYVVQDISCKQRTYHYRGKNKERINIPHVTLEIRFAKPRSRLMIGLDPEHRTVISRRSEEVTVELDLHKNDLEKLINDLSTILEAMDE
jgi:hypothetical protein